MPRQIYNSEVRYLFKKIPNTEETDGTLKDMGHQLNGVRFLCKVTEVRKNTGDLMLGNRQSEATDKIKTVAQLNFEDGDLVGTHRIRTPDNAGMISDMTSKLLNQRGARHRKNPLREYQFLSAG